MIRVALAALFAGLAGPALAECDAYQFDGAPFTACIIDMNDADLRLFLADERGELLGSFDRVEAQLRPGEHLIVAMNGGMYHEDRAPVGLYIENGRQVQGLITSDGPGNFGLLPNGVFCAGSDGTASVIETLAFERIAPDCVFATQSGPMLVLDGDLHPRFLPESDSLNIRNGVGVLDGGRQVVMAISDAPVNFHHFARFFRDVLGSDNALYLDGRVSRLFAPELGRHDRGFAALGPILGAVIDGDAAQP